MHVWNPPIYIRYLYNMTFEDKKVSYLQCRNYIIDVDLNYEVWYTKFVSLFRACHIIECHIKEVGLDFVKSTCSILTTYRLFMYSLQACWLESCI